MTVDVSVRSISALLLSVSLLGLPADALAQLVVAPQKAAPTLAERLDRLAAEVDRRWVGGLASNAALFALHSEMSRRSDYLSAGSAKREGGRVGGPPLGHLSALAAAPC